MSSNKNLLILTGNFGSGKSEIAINYAIISRSKGPVALIDLDIVKSNFRSREAENLLTDKGIKLIKPQGALSMTDLPALSPHIQGTMTSAEYKTIVDVGGDSIGAVVLGRYSKYIDGLYDMYFVVNTRRPLTSTVKQILDMKKEIEESSRLRFNGLINNTNIGNETDIEVIMGGFEIMKKVAEISRLPLIWNVVSMDVFKKFNCNSLSNTFPINLYLKPPWELRRE